MILDLSTNHHLKDADELNCCNCNSKMDGATGNGNAPTPGAISICFYCGEIMMYADSKPGMKLVKIPDEVLADIKANHPESYRAINLMSEKFKNRALPPNT